MDKAHIFHEFSIGLNDILDGISDGVFILNHHGTFVFVNHIIVDRSGISLEQFQWLTYLELVPPEHRQRAQRYFDEALAGRRLSVEEFEYYTSDNKIHVVEIRGRRIFNAKGDPLVFVIARNITERKTAEKERIRALQEKAAFLNAMSDGLLVFNRAGMVIETILVIDDEEAVLTATTRLLTKLGYLVHAANNAEDALKALKGEPSRFSCVLLDMVMPGTKVADLLKDIYALRADIPIVLMSGYRPEESIPSSLRATCRWFLQKPCRAEEISKILRLALDSK